MKFYRPDGTCNFPRHANPEGFRVPGGIPQSTPALRKTLGNTGTGALWISPQKLNILLTKFFGFVAGKLKVSQIGIAYYEIIVYNMIFEYFIHCHRKYNFSVGKMDHDGIFKDIQGDAIHLGGQIQSFCDYFRAAGYHGMNKQGKKDTPLLSSST